MAVETRKEGVRIAVNPGDGIAKEVCPAAEAVLLAANELGGRDYFKLTHFNYNAGYYLQNGRAWPEGTPAMLMREFDALLMIALGDPRVPNDGMAHAEEIIIRTARQLFQAELNQRPFFAPHPCTIPTVQSKAYDFQLFSLSPEQNPVRENVDSNFAQMFSVEIVERQGAAAFETVLRQACAAAQKGNDKRCMVLHKANILRFAHGHWSEVVKKVAGEAGVRIEMQLMDSFLERLVKSPEGLPRILVTDATFAAVLKKPLEVLKAGDRGQIPPNIQGVVVRENLEGMYVMRGSVSAQEKRQIGAHTRNLVTANILSAAELARQSGQTSFTVLHIGDRYPQTLKFWQQIAKEVASRHSMTVSFMHLGDYVATAIANPAALNGRVFAAENLIGDLAGDTAAALVGGLGIPPTHSRNTTGSTNKSFFEPLHGSAPDRAGKNVANPTATFLTAEMTLRHYGHEELAGRLRTAIYNVLDRDIRTLDLGGSYGTSQFTQEVMTEFRRLAG